MSRCTDSRPASPSSPHSTASERRLASRLVVLVGFLALTMPATAQFVSPPSTQVGVEADAAHTDGHTGVARNTYASGPLSDAASDVYGLDGADSSASVDATGLRASTAVHADPITGAYVAAGRSFASIVDPFFLVPQAGFTGTQALLRIPFTFAGSLDLLPTFDLCASCVGLVQTSLGVDGMTDRFSFFGVLSHGTQGSADFLDGAVALSGVLEGLVPVNTELYLRADLLAYAYCEADTYTGTSCGARAIFGDALAYTAYSPDAVGFVWGLTPGAMPPVPEPSTVLLLACGLAAVFEKRRRISSRQRAW